MMVASEEDQKKVVEGLVSVNQGPQNSLEDNVTFARNSSSFPNSNEFLLSILLFMIDGYAVTVLAVIGIVLNIVGIYFLSNGPMCKKLYSLFLSTLFVFDAFLLTFEFVKRMDSYFFEVASAENIQLYHRILNSGIRFSMISSTFMLIAIARVRLNTIREPLLYNSRLISGKKRLIYWMRNIIAVICLSTALELGPIIITSTMGLTQLSSALYVGVINLGIVGLVPMICLLYLVYQMGVALERKNKRARALRLFQGNQEVQIKVEDKTTSTLVLLITAFIPLNLIRIILVFGEIYILLDPDNKQEVIINSGFVRRTWCYIIASLSEFFIVANSTVNVVIHLTSM